MKAEYLAKISLGGMVTEDDVAAMTLFLCAPDNASASMGTSSIRSPAPALTARDAP